MLCSKISRDAVYSKIVSREWGVGFGAVDLRIARSTELCKALSVE
jgi:hypothetical protein